MKTQAFRKWSSLLEAHSATGSLNLVGVCEDKQCIPLDRSFRSVLIRLIERYASFGSVNGVLYSFILDPMSNNVSFCSCHDSTMMNTTMSAAFDTSVMPDQKLQERCRRLESQHSSLNRRHEDMSKSLKEKTESLKSIQAEKNVLERNLAEAVADLTVNTCSIFLSYVHALSLILKQYNEKMLL